MSERVTAEDIADAIERGDEATEEVAALLPWNTNWTWANRLWQRGCDLYDRRHEEG